MLIRECPILPLHKEESRYGRCSDRQRRSSDCARTRGVGGAVVAVAAGLAFAWDGVATKFFSDDVAQRAFPGVPCLFLYRDPAEVLASQLRMPGMYMLPGVLDSRITGIDVGTLSALTREDQYARVLEWILAAGLAQAEAGRVTLVNYTELPGAAVRQLLECRSHDVRVVLPVDDRDSLHRLLVTSPSMRAVYFSKVFVSLEN